MRKCVWLSDDLWSVLKVKAAQERVSLGALCERLLRAALAPNDSAVVAESKLFAAESKPASPIVGKMIVTTPVREREYVYDASDSQVRRR